MFDNISADTACKYFFNKNLHFSSLCNAVLHDGQNIIRPESLSPWNNEETSIISQDGKEILDIRRLRDTVKKADMHGIYSIIGIESQSAVDFSMAIRVPIYDLLNYYNQYVHSEVAESQRELIPVTTIVLYVGEGKWTGAKSLKEMMKDMPKEMEGFINDWKLILIDIKEIDTRLIKDKETRGLIETIKNIYEVKKGKRIEGMHISKEAAIVAGAITKAKWLIEEAKNLKGREEIDMCDTWEEVFEKIRVDGKTEERKIIITKLLTRKLGKLSNMIIEAIENSSTEAIELLTVSIFDIESEEDILQIIH